MRIAECVEERFGTCQAQLGGARCTREQVVQRVIVVAQVEDQPVSAGFPLMCLRS